jgi:hypothetical protein
MKFKVNLTPDMTGVGTPADQMPSPERIWVGFKDSLDSIEKYEILANGISKYNQNFVIEESYITNCASLETIKNADIYSKARHKDVWDNNYKQKCGAILDFAGRSNYKAIIDEADPNYTDGVTLNPSGGVFESQREVTIKLKIDLRRFLPLSNIKYLPAFAGKLELRICFGTSGLVWCPLSPYTFFNNDPAQIAKAKVAPVTCEFVQIGDSAWIVDDCTATGTKDDDFAFTAFGAKEHTLSVIDRTLVVERCESTIYCFGISQALYDGLVQRYTQMTLTYPTQVLNFSAMSNTLAKNVNGKSSQTITPRFIDTIFLLFPLTARHHSVFRNPGFTNFYLTCGGYGQLPDIPYGTVNEPRFLELLSNALNVNCNSVGLNKEVLNSIIMNDNKDSAAGRVLRDRSSFLIGIPTETDGTFQQGQTSTTPVTYELHVTQTLDDKSTGTPGSYYAMNCATVPIIAMLQDAVISIQVMPDGSPPLVEIGPFDITSPVSQ